MQIVLKSDDKYIFLNNSLEFLSKKIRNFDLNKFYEEYSLFFF